MSIAQTRVIRPLRGIGIPGIRGPALAQTARSRPLFCSTAPATQRSDTILFVALQQRRHQSSSPVPQRPGEKQQKQQPSSSATLLRVLRQGLTFRPLINAFRGQGFRRLYRQSPEELILAIVILSGATVMVGYVIYTYFNYFQSKQFTRFPPDVAKSMRRALYYSNYGPDPKLALKYYKLALEQCDRHGIDPFTDEVLGIKIQLAAWLEQVGSYNNSIEVLEALLRDCKRWVEKMEQTQREGLIDQAGNLIGFTKQEPEKETDPSANDQEPKIPENLFGKRKRVLGRAVGISVKLGELYADEHVLQGDKAGERLVWAVETVLKELQRRQIHGVREGEGDWMTPEQIGGALEALANHYESKSQHYLAAPLYLQALTLSPSQSCHTAVLMNNLAISLAQQPIPAAGDSTVSSKDAPRPTRASLLASARSWALQAHATGSKITGEDRTEECDEACAVALCNLGEIAAMSGDKEEARKRFQESLALSQRIGFEPGINQAQDRLSASSP
ncbi:hypothetical protein BX600DRAFT_509734 [Xylariales sp. PMI_506]|nr:hypothetical protein BX600DRAFT_509734 [Xylariales sp. PMI_506]